MTETLTMSAFLTDAEIEFMTGYKRPAEQIRWLKNKHVPHWVNRIGKPVVRRDFGGHQRKELGRVR